MKEIVFTYLSKNYGVDNHYVFIGKAPYPNTRVRFFQELLYELSLIFSLSVDELEIFIKEWILISNHDFPIKDYEITTSFVRRNEDSKLSRIFESRGLTSFKNFHKSATTQAKINYFVEFYLKFGNTIPY